LFYGARGCRGGNQGKWGREVHGRREKRGQEAGVPKWRKAGERGGIDTTLHNITWQRAKR